MAGVIWVIGCCMILMAALINYRSASVGTADVVIIAAHDLLDSHLREVIQTMDQNPLSGLWKICTWASYAGPDSVWADGSSQSGGAVLDHSLDWGDIAAGYAFGKILTLEAPVRHRALFHDRRNRHFALSDPARFQSLRRDPAHRIRPPPIRTVRH